MKSGLKEGDVAEIGIVVDESMFASFGGKVVHELFSTFSLVHYMELVARKIILPYLEEKEEGMGCAVSVEHLQPAVKGSRVKLVARVCGLKSNKVECVVEAFGPAGKIAMGRVCQAIVERSWLQKRIAEISQETAKMNAALFDTQQKQGDENGRKNDCAV